VGQLKGKKRGGKRDKRLNLREILVPKKGGGRGEKADARGEDAQTGNLESKLKAQRKWVGKSFEHGYQSLDGCL